MKKTLIVKQLYQGCVMRDGKRGFAQEIGDMKLTIGAAVLNFLYRCGGDTITVTIEGPDKEKEELGERGILGEREV